MTQDAGNPLDRAMVEYAERNKWPLHMRERLREEIARARTYDEQRAPGDALLEVTLGLVPRNVRVLP